MPRVQEKIPEGLRPYVFHGVAIDWNENKEQAVGDCPFCGREGKFSVVVATGQWRCFVCNEGEEKGKAIKGGNAHTFIRRLHELSYQATDAVHYQELADDRKLLDYTTLVSWNVCRSILTNDWLIPGYGVDGKLNQLYRYIGSPKRKLLPTPTLGHQLHYQSFDPKKEYVLVCEGPWDGMAMWETLGQTKISGDQFQSTGNVASSILSNMNVIAVPGCETFLDPWLSLLTDKKVILAYDSDHPREHAGRVIPPAGYAGLSRVASIAASANGSAPSSIEYLRWGEEGYDPALPSGYDVRDHLACDSRGLAERITRLAELFGLFTVFATDASTETVGASTSNGKLGKMGNLTPLKCTDYKTVVNAWRKALKWTDGLDCALSSMLATVMSTKSVGDQLWIKVMGPPASGKTTLADGLAVARKYVKMKDTIRGFTSGYTTPDGQTFDLASELDGFCLITADGDTLIQSPNLGNILADGRRLYDGSLGSHFKNGTGKSIDGHRMTWILCGTSSLRQLDDSELGARYLDCVIMEKIDEELEDEILMRMGHRAKANVAMQMNEHPESRKEESLTNALRLTGGYVEYLCENAGDILSSIDMDDEAVLSCAKYGKLVAFMRARPSKKQDEVQEREMATRLVSQITRYAVCTAGVMNRTYIDAECLRRTRGRAIDTSRGQSLEIVESLIDYPNGTEVKMLHHLTGRDESKLRHHLKFLKHLGVVELSKPVLQGNIMSKALWSLTPRLRKLYSDVMGE